MSIAKKTGLGGMLAALSLLFLFLANITPLLDLCMAIISSFMIVVAMIEIGRKWAFMMFAAVSILGFFIVPIRAPLILFIVLLGYYPIVKSFAERQKRRLYEFLIKFAVFNAAFVICICFFKELIFFDAELTTTMTIAFLVIGNGIFLLYDFALTRLIAFYMYGIRPKLKLNR